MPGRPAARAASSLATSSEPSAWNSARSPHTRIGRWRSASSVPDPGQAARGLRVAEPGEPRLGQRVDRDDRRAALLGGLQRAEHPWVVASGVLADDEDELGLVDVVEAHAALTDPGHLGQRDGRRLVAHVRAVRQVVRAEGAHEQLVEERRLVRRAPGGVEDRLVRALQGPQRRPDEPEGVVPVDRRVVGGPFAAHHRVGEAALLAEPVVGVRLEVVHRVRGEELRADPQRGPLLGDRLHPVLAELGRMPVLRVRVRPRASGAVEPFDLVELQQAPGRAAHAHRPDGAVHRDGHGGYARGGVLRARHLEL